MRDYRKYKVWDLGHEITLEIYTVTRDFPKNEMYGLVSQMRRAASSVPANIAEGYVVENLTQNSNVFL
ncbi:four helix bundle protein [Maribacter algarum]|uniref:four helix bundle protein n=1 Tax=Maribacter algarum (ex Zhang et al. 2020) TaxID=2578118 RepID=UPI00267D5ECA|nr:four helix bundle protein [Maribacter algarum]